MSSINKKDLRLLRPGELIMAKKDIVLFYPNGSEDEQTANNWVPVTVGQGDIMLVIEDCRKINLVPQTFPINGKILKVLFGDKILWLNKANHEILSKWVMPVDPSTYVVKEK